MNVEFINDEGFSFEFNTDLTPLNRFATDAEPRNESRQKFQEHGEWPSYTYFGRRLFVIEGSILAGTTEEYMAARLDIMKVLQPYPQRRRRKIGTLYLDLEGLTERITAECTVDSYPDIPIVALYPAASDFQIIWKAFDPRLYGENEQSQTITFANDVQGGRFYDKTFDRMYSPGGGTDAVNIYNGGNVESSPVAEIFGPCSSPQIQLINADSTISAVELDNLSLDSGESVVVDFKQRSAFKGSLNLYEYTIGSDWWDLMPGSNTVRYFAYSADTGSHVTFTWRNAYMI